MQNKMAYQLPKICCRCGEKQGTKTYRNNASQVTGFGYYVVAFSVKKSLYSFDVPVCDECDEKLARSNSVIKAVRIIISLLITGLFLYGFISQGYLFSGLILSIAIYAIFFLTLIKRPIARSGLGKISGEYFWFSNKEFFRQFAELNPKLVSPYQFRPVTAQPVNSVNTEKRSRFSLPDRNLWLLLIMIILVVFGVCFLCVSLWLSIPK